MRYLILKHINSKTQVLIKFISNFLSNFNSYRTLHERCAEHAWDDKDSIMFNHLNECIGVQIMFEIGKLTPSLLTNNVIDDEFDLRSSYINLVQMNT